MEISKPHTPSPEQGEAKEDQELVFALDIGTRSVIGIVAQKCPEGLKIIDTERLEHRTRSMLDGQIHDVPQVAEIIKSVKAALEKRVGTLKSASVAAAGRALYTMTAEAEMHSNKVITAEEEKQLNFLAVQEAQKKLAASDLVSDTSLYYCVGYSTIYYSIDDMRLKSLIGQRGKTAKANVIATFLPRQVVDSMRSALASAGLEMQGLTLEPIAAISVLIPATMRHLNLVLVDIGAGTSDIAITRDGSVVAYGMVPMAGDEITEAISRQYLLDFNVAEQIKRELSDGDKEEITFKDILGIEYKLSPKEITENIMSGISDLAKEIASQITVLNNEAPQAVMLVGGGSQTPHLAKEVASDLNLPETRVAVRIPEQVEKIIDIPDALKKPDAITPLGILKTTSLQSLNFISVYINGDEYNLFNFKDFTIADAFLNADINIHKYNGRPGMGITITINGKTKTISGTMGSLAQITLNGKPASLTDKLCEGAQIEIKRGEDGQIPQVRLCDIIDTASAGSVSLNGSKVPISRLFFINDEPATDSEAFLKDQDCITFSDRGNIAGILQGAGYNTDSIIYHYTLNGTEKTCESAPTLLLNGKTGHLSDELKDGDEITFVEPKRISLNRILDTSNKGSRLTVTFNGKPCTLSLSGSMVLYVNGSIVKNDHILNDGDDIVFTPTKASKAMINDVMLVAGYEPPRPDARVKFLILKNGAPAEFTTPVSDGDNIKIILTPIEDELISNNK